MRAEATVDGEQLVSEPFAVPASGGLRVILVAGLKEAAARRERKPRPPRPRRRFAASWSSAPNSRILMEFQDDALQVFYVLDIVNNARTRVDIGGPLILDLPTGAGGAAMLQGSSPTATVSGDRVTVTGPFAPGNTLGPGGFQAQSRRARPHGAADVAGGGGAAARGGREGRRRVDVVAAVFDRRRGARRERHAVPAGRAVRRCRRAAR